ncbi:MAG: C25 family cysteine peptidase [Thermoplasmatota archaeon]
MLVTTGFSVLSIAEPERNDNTVLSSFIQFSEPELTIHQEHISISLEQATSYLNNPDYYQLPVVTEQFVFPFKTSITDISVDFLNEYEIPLEKSIRSGPITLPDTTGEIPLLYPKQKEINLESSIEIYPEDNFKYHIAAGRIGTEIQNILSISLFPIQYSPSQQKLICYSQAEIVINYQYPDHPYILNNEYELLVVGPNAFSNEIQPLIDHKIDTDMDTKFVTVEEVFNGKYFTPTGRDDAEILKFFIKDALDEWGITYVLLIGGRKGGIFEETYWVPVRYSDLDDTNVRRFVSDLYFADIYDSEGNFSSWDSNENDLFSEWTHHFQDIPEMYPDVFVGRLACRSKLEVRIVVDKIINYEIQAYNQDWFKRYIGIAGDTYPDVGDPYYEGELATEAAAAYLEELGFDITFLWTSTGTFSGPQDVIREISRGAGFAHFSGHGNPASWSNHPPNDKETWVNGLTNKDMWLLNNDEQLPVTIVGGCSNGQFNVSLTNMIRDITKYGINQYFFEEPYHFYRRKALPHCWSWSLVNKRRGGAIAVISNTCLGYGIRGENWNTGRGRWMEMAFYQSYSEGNTILGQTHGQNMIYYLDEFYSSADKIDIKMVQQWALLGDPSLRIGGVPS